ncbi:MAG TPA: EpsI family protein [bacterium]|nr:EpsI family protein [bacterium]
MDRRAIALAAGALLTAAGAWASDELRNHHALPVEDVDLARVPLESGLFLGTDMEVGENVLRELRSDSLLLREYGEEGQSPVWVYVDYHRSQRLGAQIHSPRNCYPGGGWTVLASVDEMIEGPNGPWPACWLTLGNDHGEKRIALFWFVTRWGSSTHELALKRDLLRSSLGRRPTDAALVRLSTDAEGAGDRAAKDRILRLLDALAPELDRELPFARTGA